MNMTVDAARAASMTDSRCWPNGTLGGILYQGREQFGDQQHPAHDHEAGSDQEQAVVPRLGSRAAVGHGAPPAARVVSIPPWVLMMAATGEGRDAFLRGRIGDQSPFGR
jgi:hypothetical protein